MEIPPSTLEELKCSVCEGYLSRSPVYIQQDSAAVCGVCFTPKREAIRNKQYEATAKLLLFPCKNRDLGCQENVPFVNGEEVIGHEDVCQHRQYVCPVLGSANCDWIGTRTKILEHCEEQHADKVKENPTTLTHDISKSSEQTFLLHALQLMFLLHVKICTTAGKIYYSIRHLGCSDEAKKFTFNLDIKRNGEHIRKIGLVAPQGCLSIQEDSSLTLNTNSLLNMLGGFDGTTFTVTVERSATASEKCSKCGALVTSFIYYKRGGWRCNNCRPTMVNCINRAKGCTYINMPRKTDMHQEFFCKKSSYCHICKKASPEHLLYSHYNSKHTSETFNSGSSWRAKRTDSDLGESVYCLLSNVSGIGMCQYQLYSLELMIYVYIPVTCEQLHQYLCLISVTEVASKQTHIYRPEVLYNDYCDWFIRVNKNEFNHWGHEFDIIVDIIKIKD